jgi:hypothetical protein
MRRRLALGALAVVVPLGLALAPVVPRRSGVLPGEALVPPNLTTAFPACGFCHNSSPNANGPMQIAIDAPRSLEPGSIVTVDVAVSGGPGIGLGGFCMESDAGVLIPSLDTRTTPTGDAITHSNGFFTAWQFQYQAPSAPGLVHWTAAGQSVNGYGTIGDSWGFYGPDTSVPGVPFRLFVNGPHVRPFGEPCAGTDGHEPILGTRAPMTTGQRFVLEVHNAPPGALVHLAAGASSSSFQGVPLPYDLAGIGAPGCAILIDHLLVQSGVAVGAGSGGGSALFDWPVPNVPALRGTLVYFQAYVVDPAANAAGITVTQALEATLQ